MILSRPLKTLLMIAFTGAVFLGLHSMAFAADATEGQTLGKLTNNLFDSFLSIQTFLSVLSYILGVFFSITGLQMLRASVDDPGRNPAMPALMRLGAAGFFIFAPTFANMIVNAVSGGGVGDSALLTTRDVTQIPNTQNGEGLDGALIKFVKDFATPFMENLLPFFAYIAGLVFMLVGLKRLALGNGDGPQAPGGMGTFGTFFVAAALMAFGYIMYTLQGSIFGSTTLYSNPIFKVENVATDMQERANQAMWGVFIFLRVVGYISVLRGLFMLRGAGEGQNVSMMAVFTHLIAGAMLASATSFVLAVQSTFLKPENFILSK